MPFLGQNMTPIGGNSRAGQVASKNAPMGWAYQSLTDDRADIQGIGYFDPFNNYLAAGQFIYANLADGKFIFTISSVDRPLKQVVLDLDIFSPTGDDFAPDVFLDSDAVPGRLFAISGFDVTNNVPTVDHANNDIDGTLRPAIGVSALATSAGAVVKLLMSGEVSGLNTSSFEVGERLYLVAGGGFSNVSPNDWSQDVGYVTKKDMTEGRVFFSLSSRTEIVVEDTVVDTGNRTVEAGL